MSTVMLSKPDGCLQCSKAAASLLRLCSTLYPNHIDYPCYGDPWKRNFEIQSIKDITVCWLVVTGTLMP